VSVILASSSPEDEIEHYLELLDARPLVDGWTTKDDVEQTKPEPDLVKAALAKLDDGEAILVGDTKWDVEAAARAGIPVIGVKSGGWWRDELLEAGAVAVYESVQELGARLDETPFAR
jgi:phosphoglycolate phosphatase-like HAD superfamily hydrolase